MLSQITVNKKYPISKLKFNISGSLLAITSSHEIDIAVFSTLTGKKIAELNPQIATSSGTMSKNVPLLLNCVQDMSFCPQTAGRFMVCLL